MRALIIITLLTGSAAAGGWSQEVTQANKIWGDLLSRYVRDDGGVDFVGFATEGAKKLAEFVGSHRSVDPTGFNDSEKKALYINLYNAGMIHNLLRYARENKIAVDSKLFTEIVIKDIAVAGGNIWNGDYRLNLGGQLLNLDEIEHGLIRGRATGKLSPFRVEQLDPRIHSAVNCAALSCPKLRKLAYTPVNIDSLLDENMTVWLSDDRHFRKIDKDTLQVNSIVIWYYDDFDDHAQKVLKLKGAGHYLAPYIGDKSPDASWKRKFLEKEFSDRNSLFLRLSSDFKSVYDWRITDIRVLGKG